MNFLKFFPYILDAVSTVETKLPTIPGASKKEIVLAGIHAAAQVGEAVPVPQIAAISALIDLLVAALNKSGAFGHTPTPTPTPALAVAA